jgi:hypothetical protein
LFIVQGFFCVEGDYAGLSQWWLWEYHMMLGAHVFALPNVSQADIWFGADIWWLRSLPAFSV